MIAILISTVVFVSYVAYIWIKYGAQKSISQSYYNLPTNKRWVFSVFILGFTLPLALLATFNNLVYLPIGAWLVSGVAVTCNLNNSKFTKVVHMIMAIGGIVFSLFSLWYECEIWQPSIYMLIASVCCLFMTKKPIWWIEIFGFVSIILGYIVYFS